MNDATITQELYNTFENNVRLMMKVYMETEDEELFSEVLEATKYMTGPLTWDAFVAHLTGEQVRFVSKVDYFINGLLNFAELDSTEAEKVDQVGKWLLTKLGL